MSFIEFLGLIISFIALLILSIKQSRQQREEHHQSDEQNLQTRKRNMQALFRKMHIELEEEEEQVEEVEEEPDWPKNGPKPLKTPIPKTVHKSPIRTVGNQYALNYRLNRFKQVRPIDQQHLKSAIDERKISRQVVSSDMLPERKDAYSVRKRSAPSLAKQLVSGVMSPRQMIVLHEILNSPYAPGGPFRLKRKLPG